MRSLRTALFILAVLLMPAHSISQHSDAPEEVPNIVSKWADRNDEATSLYRARRYADAIVLYEANLALADVEFGEDHPNTLRSINNLASSYQALGRYSEAEPLFLRALAAIERLHSEDHPSTLTAVTNLASIFAFQGRYGDAELLYQRVLVLRERALGEEHPDTLSSINSLAAVYQALGRYGEVESLFLRTLVLRERVLGEEHPDTLTSINNLAGLYEALGRYGEAEPLHLRALAASERVLGEEHSNTLIAVDNLAGLYLALGRYDEAEPLHLRALAGFERVLGEDHPNTLKSINNVASLYQALGRYGEAEPLFLRALAVSERVLGEEHPGTITSINNLAGLYQALGRYGEAEALFLRALAVSERVLGEDHPNTLRSIHNLASSYQAQGRYSEAEPLFLRALAVSERVLGSDHIDRAGKLGNYALGLASRDTSRLAAIYYLKQAVNVLQVTRANMSGLDDASQAAFLAKRALYYETLQLWLVESGRFAEAEKVGRMLKEQEFFEFVRRRSSEDGPRASRSELTSLEAEWEAQLASWAERPNRIAAELAVLKTKQRGGGELTSLEQSQLDDLQTRYDVAYTEYKTRIDGWLASVGELSDDAIQREAEELQARYHDNLQLEIEEIGADVAALQLVAFEDSAHAFLITPGAFKHIELPITRTELFQAIYAARRAVQPNPQTGKLDPDANVPLQALHEILMAPIEQELADAGTRTLMLNLQGAIRYVPFAALYDGELYLTERYKLAMFTPAANTKYQQVDGLQEAAGFGVAMEYAPFKALTNVTRELTSILGSEDEPGILSGPSYLDAAFTKDVLKSELEEGRPILHIASHFTMRPGNDSNSFLLLGDGTKLTLAEINETRALRFKGVELLTLSACSTALSTEGSFGVDSGTGVEVEGFGVLAQRKGAKAVIASLWDVNDSSTADLMTELYTNLAIGQMDKAEALQAAQLSMLATEDRSHPYYWAPFILMGNWK